MSYSSSKIEVMRFGGRKGGEGIGCCAIDVIQGFTKSPNSKAAVELMHGDSGTPLFSNEGGTAWLGTTNLEIFQQYLRIGTFDLREQPNRAFLCALTDEQIYSGNGQAWLAILREEGFKFLFTVDNSVYTGTGVEGVERTWVESECDCCEGYFDDGYGDEPPHPVHVFGLIRNIGLAKVDDPFTPPQAWLDLPEPTKSHLDLWKERTTTILTEDEAKGLTPEEVAAKVAAEPAVAKPW